MFGGCACEGQGLSETGVLVAMLCRQSGAPTEAFEGRLLSTFTLRTSLMMLSNLRLKRIGRVRGALRAPDQHAVLAVAGACIACLLRTCYNTSLDVSVSEWTWNHDVLTACRSKHVTSTNTTPTIAILIQAVTGKPHYRQDVDLPLHSHSSPSPTISSPQTFFDIYI